MNLVFPHTFVPWFRAVAPYMHAYRGKTFVVAMAGELIAAGKLNAFVQDLAILHSMGIKLVLVHGFRPQVNEQLAAKGHVSRFSHGLRITDAVALDAAQEAAGQLRFEIEAAFSQGLPNTPMANSTVRVVSGNFLTARPVGIVDGVDFMHSGAGAPGRRGGDPPCHRHRRAGAAQPLRLLAHRRGLQPDDGRRGHQHGHRAARRQAAVPDRGAGHPREPAGRRQPPSTPSWRWPTPSACWPTLPAPTQPSDTAFYLQHCVRACEGGVERSHILPFAIDGALLLEVFTHDGIGTMVVDEKLESLREATADDVGGILQLIEPFERDGTLVRRERTEIERDIANYTVIEHDGIIFGCAALYPYPEARTGEMAALTVSAQVQGQGDGERILKRIEQRAKSMGLDSIFVLSTRTMHWFIKRGFVQVDPDRLPEARKTKIQLGPALDGAGQEARLMPGPWTNRRSSDDGANGAMHLPEEGSPGPGFLALPGRTRQAHLRQRQQGSLRSLEEAPDDAGQ